MKEVVLKVEGMMCEGCENRVKNIVNAIDGVEDVSANHVNGEVIVKSNESVDIQAIKDAIEDIGYEVIKEG